MAHRRPGDPEAAEHDRGCDQRQVLPEHVGALARAEEDRDQEPDRGEDDRGADHARGPADGALAPEDLADQRLAGLPAHAAAGARSRGPCQANPRTPPGPDGDVAPARRFMGPGRREVVGAQDAAEDHAHLEHREAHPDAAPAPAAERDPGVGAGLLLKETLGPEGVGLGVDVGVVVQEIRVGHERAGLGLVVPAADRDRLGDEPGLAVGQHRTAPERLLDRRQQVVLGAALGANLLGEAAEDLGLAAEALERPRERGRRGLVPGDEEGHQLVAELLPAHLGSVLVAGGEQHRQHVVASVVVPGTALGDQLRDQLVRAVAVAQHPLQRAGTVEPAQRPLHLLGVVGSLDQRQRVVAVGEERGQALADRVEARAGVEAEHRAEDDLERERLEARV